MKLPHSVSLACAMIALASFTLPSATTTVMEKTVVYKVSYDAKASKLIASEKLEISSELLQRSSEGKIISINKDAILSQMPMATRMMEQSLAGNKNGFVSTYALVSVYSQEKASFATTDMQLLDFLQKSFESFSRNAFTGPDHSITGKNWNCSGGSCNMQVPAGVDVFVWEQ